MKFFQSISAHVQAVTFCLLSALMPACNSNTSDLVQGYVEGEFVYIASPLSGQLEQLSVERGSQTLKGTRLFALESVAEQAAREEAEQRLRQAQAGLEDAKKGLRPSEMESLEARLRQAQAALVLSEEQLSRQDKLLKSGVTSQEDLDRARSEKDQNSGHVVQLEAELATGERGAREDQVAAAEAEVNAMQAALKLADWNLSQKTQAAPADALVFDTLYREGEWVPAGKPVVALLPPAAVKVRAFVSETRLAGIHVGDAVRVFVDGVDAPFSGKVTFISPQAEYTPPVIYSRESREKFVFLIEVGFEESTAVKLHPGQPVDVAFGK